MVMPRAGPRVPGQSLENFWRRVSEAARFSPLRRGPLDVILGRWTLEVFAYLCRHGSHVSPGVAL